MSFTQEQVIEGAVERHGREVCIDLIESAMQEETLEAAIDLIIMDTLFWES